MNPFVFVLRHPIVSFLVAAGMVSGGVFALEKRGIDVVPGVDMSKLHVDKSQVQVVLDYIGMGKKGEEGKEGKEEGEGKEESHAEHHKLVVSSPLAQDVTLTQDYVCQIRSQRHIEVCALESGYLQEILVKEGQRVKKGDLMFKILPVLYKAKLDAELAEARLAQLEYNYTKKLAEGKLPVVSKNEVPLLEAKLAKAQAKAQLAGAELEFTNVKAPFSGIVDRLHEQLGSLIDEGDVLTTLSDNSVMWVYFNVPEKRYLEYMADLDHKSDQQIELVLANGNKFPQPGKIGAIEANFNNETGNIAFRADFPNPSGLLRHGQTGTVLIRRVSKGAVVIPQRATFELLDKRFVYVIGEDHVAHQRLITVENELEDTFVVKSGLDVKDRIVVEGAREVRDGDKVDYEFRKPEEILAHQKYHAE